MERDRSPAVQANDLEAWPVLPLESWEATYATLHRWMQIVGKIRLALCADVNHWWHATLYVTPRGLTTGPIPYGQRMFQMDFDFLKHELRVTTADDESGSIPLVPRSVADFYHETLATLAALRLPMTIWTTPVEVEDRTPFEEDHKHASYDPEKAQRCWRILLQAYRVLTLFRGRFIGKVSPVHFFWGSFDLAVTRFSGRPAPQHAGVPNLARFVAREAYSHEVSSCGFWPGAGHGEPAFMHTPTRNRRDLNSIRFNQTKRTTTRLFENSSCRMRPYAWPTCRTMHCWRLPKPRTKPQPLAGTGKGKRWSAHIL